MSNESGFAGYSETFKRNLNCPMPVYLGQAESLLSDYFQRINAAGHFPAYKLFSQSLGGIRAAILLTLGGATGQVPSILRHSIEAASYAVLFEHKQEWEEVWALRHQSNSKKKKFRDKGLGAAREVLSEYNLRDMMVRLYDLCIDVGAHPNVWGVNAGITYQKLENGDYFVDLPQLHGQQQKDQSSYVIVQVIVFVLEALATVWPEQHEDLLVGLRSIELLNQAEAFSSSDQ